MASSSPPPRARTLGCGLGLWLLAGPALGLTLELTGCGSERPLVPATEQRSAPPPGPCTAGPARARPLPRADAAPPLESLLSQPWLTSLGELFPLATGVTPDGEAWLLGRIGVLRRLHRTARLWQPVELGTDEDLIAFSRTADEAFVLGRAGGLWRWRGARRWQPVELRALDGAALDLGERAPRALWAGNPAHIWIAGDAGLLLLCALLSESPIALCRAQAERSAQEAELRPLDLLHIRGETETAVTVTGRHRTSGALQDVCVGR